jgi:hypothetical protein
LNGRPPVSTSMTVTRLAWSTPAAGAARGSGNDLG